MNISHNKYDAIENLIFIEGLKITSIEINPEHDKLFIHLNNDHQLTTPVINYRGLRNANLKQLKNFHLVGNGTGIHWPDLDEDLSLKGFLKEFLKQKVNTEKELILA